jgi:hypothetical protein
VIIFLTTLFLPYASGLKCFTHPAAESRKDTFQVGAEAQFVIWSVNFDTKESHSMSICDFLAPEIMSHKVSLYIAGISRLKR